MKVLVFSSFFFALLLGQVSCASKKAAQDINATDVTEQTSNTTKVSKSDTLFASLDRSFCFGKCPVYKVEIYQSGYAVYTGQANTDMIGTFTSHFSKEQLNSLVKVAKEINYMSLDDVYDNPGITDIPSHISSIVIDGKRKEVKRRVKYPESILSFENQIDQIVSEVKWTEKK